MPSRLHWPVSLAAGLTLLINGLPAIASSDAPGAQVTFTEHVAPILFKNCATHFIDGAALQCGICTPGFLMAAQALLRKNPDPTEEEIRFGLAGNLCRCTGYDKIVRAVQAAAKDMRA